MGEYKNKTNIEKFLELVPDGKGSMIDVVKRKVTLELSVAQAIELLDFLSHFNELSHEELEESKDYQEQVEIPNNYNMFGPWQDTLNKVDEVEEILKNKLNKIR